MKAVILASVLFIVGCDEFRDPLPDQKLRREIFIACLEKAPAGPVATQYNDWSEVISECNTAAYYQSLILPTRGQK